MMKPETLFTKIFPLVVYIEHEPVYVMRYATTIQPVLLKPCKSSVIATSDVLTIEISRLGRKMAKETLEDDNPLNFR